MLIAALVTVIAARAGVVGIRPQRHIQLVRGGADVGVDRDVVARLQRQRRIAARRLADGARYRDVADCELPPAVPVVTLTLVPALSDARMLATVTTALSSVVTKSGRARDVGIRRGVDRDVVGIEQPFAAFAFRRGGIGEAAAR